MPQEQAPAEHTHHQRLDENNTQRKRPREAQPADEDGTHPSPKRQLRHMECDRAPKEKNMEEAQQGLQPEGDNGGQKRSRKRASRHISEQALRGMLQRALDTGSFAGLHPTARVMGSSIVVTSVRIEVLNTLSSLLDDPSVPRPLGLKVDLSKRSPRSEKEVSPRHGRLVVTMTNVLHEAFGQFSDAIRTVMYVQGFVPAVLDDMTIGQRGTAKIDLAWPGGSRRAQPDASLAWLDAKFPFLVFECARTQSEEDVVFKAQDYIHGSRGRISFVVMIKIETPNARRHEEPVTREPDRLAPSDRVLVSVFTPAYERKANSSRLALSMETLIERLEVFPTPPTTREFFTIRWSHVQSGPWKDFVSRYQLPLDAPEPSCDISFSHLFRIAQRHAGPKQFNNAQTPDLDDDFAHKRRSATELSSGSSVTDDEEADPDYEP